MTYIAEKPVRERQVRSKYKEHLTELKLKEEKMLSKGGHLKLAVEADSATRNTRRAIMTFLARNYTAPEGYCLRSMLHRGVGISIYLEKEE